MHTHPTHHCPSALLLSGHAPRRHVGPCEGTRLAEASDRCPPPEWRRRGADSFERSCVASGATGPGVADERIPGRLTFDLYLVRSNRQARHSECCDARPRCERPGDRDNDRDGKSGADRWRPAADGHASLSIGQAGPVAAAHAVRIAQVVIMATRRGSVIDVLG